jgi:hypothetical protein
VPEVRPALAALPDPPARPAYLKRIAPGLKRRYRGRKCAARTRKSNGKGGSGMTIVGILIVIILVLLVLYLLRRVF